MAATLKAPPIFVSGPDLTSCARTEAQNSPRAATSAVQPAKQTFMYPQVTGRDVLCLNVLLSRRGQAMLQRLPSRVESPRSRVTLTQPPFLLFGGTWAVFSPGGSDEAKIRFRRHGA